MTSVGRRYGGVSATDRQQVRRDALVTGVLDVVGMHGVTATTVDAVCAAAGLTKRYFYESFANLDAALVATMDAAFVSLAADMVSAVRTMTEPAERARTIVEILVDSLAGDPRLTRLYTEAPGHPALRQRRDVAIADFTDLLRSGELALGPVGAASGRQLLAVRLVVAGTTDLVTGWLSGAIPAARGDVIDTIVAAGLAVSGVDGSSSFVSAWQRP